MTSSATAPRAGLLALVLVLMATALSACGGSDDPDLVVYSGRSEPLMKPFIDEFAKREGLDVEVRYGDTPDLVGTLLEEGDDTRADVFVGQDAPALEKLRGEGLLQPYAGLRRAPARYRAGDGSWSGLSARARVLIVRKGTEAPRSVFDLADPAWRGRIAAPKPSNVSFRDWISAIRIERGDRFARDFLEGLRDNRLEVLADHELVAKAVAEGEFDVGLVNHYYVALEQKEGADVEAVYTDQRPGGFGVLLNAASAGILKSADHRDAARRLLDHLLTPKVQQRFAEANFEYPVMPGLRAASSVRPLDRVRTTGVTLQELGDAVDGTERLLDEVDLEG